MGSAINIRCLTAPHTPLREFDPGEYLSELELEETGSPVTDEGRDELAQFTHYLAFLALQAGSSQWDASVVRRGTSAYRAFESYFGHLEGWRELAACEDGLHYRALAGFLMRHYPPHSLSRDNT